MLKNGFRKSAVVLLLITLAMTALGLNVYAADSQPGVTIIHTNDRHGRTDAEPYISYMAKQLKAEGKNVLVLDAGDSLHGQTPTNLSKGETMVDIMNAVGYSAMVPGNHDFNFGVDRLMEMSKRMDFPLLAANVKKGEVNLFQSYEIFEMDGLTVGVFGIATPETVTKSDPRIVAGITFENPADAAALMVEELKEEGCDIIIALAHLGVDAASEQKNRSESLTEIKGIDVIIDGHSHTLLENGKVVNGTLIAQTGSFAENFGIVEIVLADGNVTKTAKVTALPKEGEETSLVQDSDIVSKIAEEEAKIEPITSVVVGNTPVLLEGAREFVRTSETNLANMISDSMRFATKSDIAFLTGGNIRASIEAGDITMGDVLTTLPFSNLLATVELTGAEMLEALEHGVSRYPEPAGEHIQVSGIEFEFDPAKEPMSRVKKVTMSDGSEFDTEKTYVVCTIDFITSGGDGYTVMEKARNKMYYQGDVDAFVDYIATKPKIKAAPEGRAKVVVTDSAEAVQAPSSPVVTVTDTEAVAEPAKDTAPPSPAQAQEEQASEQDVYIVQPGDYLTKIANEFGTTWRELHRLNSDILNPNLIYPGQKIILPQGVQMAS